MPGSREQWKKRYGLQVDHEGTAEVVCPRCGTVLANSCYYSDGNREVCPECSCTFVIYVNTETSFSTESTEKEEPDHDDDAQQAMPR